MFKIVKNNQGSTRQISDLKTVLNLITKDISPNVSLAVTEAKEGFYEKEVSQNDRAYFILEGQADVVSEGQEEALAIGDTCFISEGTEYEMSGAFKAIVVNHPAFGSEK